MPTKMTLWEYLSNKKKEPQVKAKFHNELCIEPKQILMFDVLDLRGTDYIVERVEEWKLSINGQVFLSTDYFLADDLKLRAIDADPSKKDDNCWLLRRIDEMEFSEDFLAVVQDAVASTFNIDDISYTRCDDLEEPYTADVTSDSAWQQVRYWDFACDRPGEIPGDRVREMLYIEMNIETGWFQLWLGTQMPLTAISVI